MLKPLNPKDFFFYMSLRTPLYDEHAKLNAKIIDFGGWEMPVYYTTVLEEHHAVRRAAGLFDTCHMGEFAIRGKDAFKLIQKVVTRDISQQSDKQMMLSVMCKPSGGIIDDLTIYRYNQFDYMIVVNAGTREKDFKWFKKAAADNDFEVELSDISMQMAKLDLQGPNTEKILQNFTDFHLSQIKFYWFEQLNIFSTPVLISRSGYTGEDGFEIYFDWEKAPLFWEELLKAGSEFGIKPCGLGARDTLRLEAAYMLYDNDIDEEHSPFEATYSWVVSLDKDFIGKEFLAKQKAEGVKRKLVGFEMLDNAIARHGYKVFSGSREIGIVTSGSLAPSLSKNIGLAYVPPEFAQPDKTFDIEIRAKKYKAKVVKLPFYKRKV